MDKQRWFVANNGTGKRMFFVYRMVDGKQEVAETADGKYRRFGSRQSAERAAEKLNDADGIYINGFEGVPSADEKLARARFLAGDTVSEVRSHFRTNDGKLTYSASHVRRMRNEVFVSLATDPEAVKALAGGPLLNASAIVRYRHSREEVASAVERVEMFSA